MSRHSFHLLGQHLTSLNMEVSGLSFQIQKADVYMTDKEAQMEAQLEEAQLREGQLRQALAQAQQQQAPAQSQQQQQQQLLEDKQR